MTKRRSSDVFDGGTELIIDEREMLEGLEDDLELKLGMIQRGDIAGLVVYLKDILDQRPYDVYTIKDLGEAHLMNGEPEKTLELLKPVYEVFPDWEVIQWSLLDALFALGLDENAFEWVTKPPIVRFSPAILDACCDYLRIKRCGVEIEDLYCRFLCFGYCTFNEDDLRLALSADDRFDVEEDDLWVTISLRDELL